ncbi:bifunctional adenosylcobinamide kinase/adenosylcobinamide-phosphate guanylyltransferase [Angustibacter sp. McL0619]|uniref:bifunctional adenosylcobinamide kinase/adenosylcobinamide-phosphate guanylyltransferase n=1 Tax=Angustibacter sp. McL0619 TaxID=3415676 RepID=UPI003CF78163
MMRVRLLGTGSADGWPNAFCECASCLAALHSQQFRGPTSALVDGRILLDCGPETPRAALRHEGGLQHVTHILITHDHPDHSAPMALLSRAWAGRTEPLTVVGPQSVIASWCLWTSPEDPVRWQAVLPGDVLDAGGYTVRVLAAAHGQEEAVVYDVCGPGGERMLYATDTGPLPEQTIAATTDAEYDLVLLEATFGDRRGPQAPSGTDHLDLSTFADQMVRLRGARALTRASRIAAVHLSHHSPPDLRPRLGAWGVQVVDDGHAFALDRVAARARVQAERTATAGVGGSRGPVDTTTWSDEPRRTLVLGGVRSGKSLLAEQLFAADAQVTYVATGYVPDGHDDEWSQRVARHRARRPTHWSTLETTDLGAVLRGASGPVIIDCLGMWMNSVLSRCGAWDEAPGWQQAVDQHLDSFVEAWHAVTVPVVAVTNEVGSGVVPGTWSGRVFRDQLGRLNTRISTASERVLLVVAGRVLDLAALSAPSAAAAQPVLDTATEAAAQHGTEPEDPTSHGEQHTLHRTALRPVLDLTRHQPADPLEQDTA